MRLLSLGLAIGAAVTLASCAERSRLPEGPYCAVTSIGAEQTSENCYLPSFEACQREVTAGNRGFCRPNPRYSGQRR